MSLSLGFLMCGCIQSLNYLLLNDILILGALWLVAMADNGTEVISLGGEHGAVCMKIFNRQHQRMVNIKMSLSVFFCCCECCDSSVVCIRICLSNRPLTWGTRPKGKKGLSSRTTSIPWSL